MVQFRELLRRITDHKVDFVIIGGLAASLYGSPVVTYDVDVCASMDFENLRRIHAAMMGINARFRMHPNRPRLYDDPERLRGFKNLNLITDLGVIDFLGDLPGIASYAEVAARAAPMDVGGFACQVVDLDSLIAAKKFAARDKDKMNLWHLEVIRKKHQQPPGLFDKPPS